MKVRSILIENGIRDVHPWDFTVPVPNVNAIALPFFSRLQSPTEDAPATSHRCGEAWEPLLYHKGLVCRVQSFRRKPARDTHDGHYSMRM